VLICVYYKVLAHLSWVTSPKEKKSHDEMIKQANHPYTSNLFQYPCLYFFPKEEYDELGRTLPEFNSGGVIYQTPPT
jgi:hypothetical protein